LNDDENDDNNDDDDLNIDAGSPTYVDENDYTNNNVRPTAPPQFDRHDNNHDIDDPPNFIQRITDLWQQMKAWYCEDVSDNWRVLIQIIILILGLYVAFGGRFGLDSSLLEKSGYNNRSHIDSAGRMGNYGKGNAYDQFYNSQKQTASSGSGTYGSKSYRGRDNYDTSYKSYSKKNGRYDPYAEQNYYGRYGGMSKSSSDWDAVVPYMIIAAIVFGLHKILGIPIQIMPMGFGMGRAFGGFGARGLRFGAGGIRFGGFPIGGFGRTRVRYNRRRW